MGEFLRLRKAFGNASLYSFNQRYISRAYYMTHNALDPGEISNNSKTAVGHPPSHP